MENESKVTYEDLASAEFAADLTKFNIGSDWTGPKASITLKASVTKELLQLGMHLGRPVFVTIEVRQRTFLTVAEAKEENQT